MCAMFPDPGGRPCESECSAMASGWSSAAGLLGRLMIQVAPPYTTDWPQSQRISVSATGLVAKHPRHSHKEDLSSDGEDEWNPSEIGESPANGGATGAVATADGT